MNKLKEHLDHQLSPVTWNDRDTHRVLSQIKGEMKVKKQLSAGAVLVILLLLATVTSFAATGGFGLIDMMNRYRDKGMLPEVTEIIESDIPQTSQATEWADFTVREAVYDGNMLYAVIAAKPLSDDVLLIPNYHSPDDPIGNLGVEGEYDPVDKRGDEDAGVIRSIAAYAKAQGKRIISLNYEVTLKDGGDYEQYNWLAGSDAVLEADGTLAYLVHTEDYQAAAESDRLDISVHCFATPITETAGDTYFGSDGELVEDIAFEYLFDERQTGQLDFSLKNNGVRAKAHSTEPIVLPEAGVRIDEIVLTSTALYTKVDLLFTWLEAPYNNKALFFDVLTDTGEVMPRGASSLQTNSFSQGVEGTSFRHISHIIAMDALPDHVTVRAYDPWATARDIRYFETVTLALTPME